MLSSRVTSQQHQDEDSNLRWMHSATGDRFPERLSTGHPLWQHFLESGSTSPTQFFRAFLAPPTYFHSPTPWRSHGRLVQKVSELLDSFRPGAYSYRPFRKEKAIDCLSAVTHNQEENDEGAVAEEQPPPAADESSDSSSDHEDDDEEEDILPQPQDEAPAAAAAVRFVPSEETRRRLYVDLGRPRPFYRRQQSVPIPDIGGESREDYGTGRSSIIISSLSDIRQPKTLQETIRMTLVREFGLDHFREMLNSPGLIYKLPSMVRDQMLTFLCEDFEEVLETAVSSSPSIAKGTGSYKVRCLLDGNIYMAIFATSEVDKNVSNLWDEYRHFIYWNHPNILSILSLVADPLTENVFFIVKDFPKTISDSYNESMSEKLIKARILFELKLKKSNLPYDFLSEDHIFLTNDGTIMLQNPLLFAKFRLQLKNTLSDGLYEECNMSDTHFDLIKDVIKFVSST